MFFICISPIVNFTLFNLIVDAETQTEDVIIEDLVLSFDQAREIYSRIPGLDNKQLFLNTSYKPYDHERQSVTFNKFLLNSFLCSLELDEKYEILNALNY